MRVKSAEAPLFLQGIGNLKAGVGFTGLRAGLQTKNLRDKKTEETAIMQKKCLIRQATPCGAVPRSEETTRGGSPFDGRGSRLRRKKVKRVLRVKDLPYDGAWGNSELEVRLGFVCVGGGPALVVERLGEGLF